MLQSADVLKFVSFKITKPKLTKMLYIADEIEKKEDKENFYKH